MSKNKSFSAETSDRYAAALYELSEENSELEIIEGNTSKMLSLYHASKELKNFITNPTYSIEIQINAINKISSIMKFSNTYKNFLSLLVVKRRIFFLEKIIQSFLNLAMKRKGKISGKLISSKKLSNDEVKNISKELSDSINGQITFDYELDESLIGGLKIQIGSLMIDSSIKNKLKKYEQLMLEC